MTDKIGSSYRLKPITVELLKELADMLGIPRQSVIDMAVRQFAKEHGLKLVKRSK